MNGLTKFILVLLRLAIGWHLLFEGVVKVRTHELGKTVTNTPFSSAPYLRDANGPLGEFFRKQAGDPDEEASERFILKSEIPSALENAWDDYYARWTAYNELSDEQKPAAQKVFVKAHEDAAHWLQGRIGEKEMTKEFAGAVAKRKRTVPDRIAEYGDKLAQVREMQEQALPEFQRDVFQKQLTDKKQ